MEFGSYLYIIWTIMMMIIILSRSIIKIIINFLVLLLIIMIIIVSFYLWLISEKLMTNKKMNSAPDEESRQEIILLNIKHWIWTQLQKFPRSSISFYLKKGPRGSYFWIKTTMISYDSELTLNTPSQNPSIHPLLAYQSLKRCNKYVEQNAVKFEKFLGGVKMQL